MSLYALAPKPGCERYTIRVGWDPHRTLFCSAADFDIDPAIDRGNPADFVQLGLLEKIFDPAVIVAAVEPYAVIPADLIERLHADMDEHPVW